MDHHNSIDDEDDELMFTVAIATTKPNTTSAKKMEIKCDTVADHHNAASHDRDFTSPSLQFSDAYFSIELSKSYPHEVKETIVSEDRVNVVRGFDRVHSHGKKQGFDNLDMGSEDKVAGDKVMVGGGAQVWEELSQKREGVEFNCRSSSIKDQTNKSEMTVSSKRSSWWRLFSFC